MRCPSCKTDNRGDRRFCAECGAVLAVTCSSCRAANEPDAKFCGACGAALTTTAAPLSMPVVRDAERRHLTVMFCDLVASTALAERLDDEDLRALMRRYYDACAETIRPYDGLVANYLGDGLLVYFGYPRAHEDDPERAVRAGLDMLTTITRDLNATLDAAGVQLAVRIGIHTGPVVVGDLGGGKHREALALGETVNVAARLQSVAAPDTVVISAATLTLVRGIFVTQDLGLQHLRGIAQAIGAHRVVQPSGVRSRLEIAAGHLTPFIGRDVELATVLDHWGRAEERQGQTLLISGDAGIGKSRLVHQLRDRIADRPHTWLECGCSPYTRDTAFHPLIALVQQGIALQPTDTAEEKVAKIERALALLGFALDDVVPLFAAFLGLPPPARYAPLAMSPELQRKKTMEALTAWVLALGELQPVLALVEDLHWADASSLELLTRLIEQTPTVRLLMVLTARPDFTPPWPARSNLTVLPVSRLAQRRVREMVTVLSAGGESLPSDMIDAIVTRADGIPLYIEELTKTVLDPMATRTVEAIPVTLHDSLMARLDRLAAAKDVAQRAAVLGREFSYALLAATAGIEEAALRHGLARLLEAEILFAHGEPPAAVYVFKHALVQEAAYGSLLRRTRQELHGKVMRALVAQFPERAPAEPEVVARHAEAAGLVDEGVTYYQRAAEQAQERSAHEEATEQLRRALALIDSLPAGPRRDQREVALQLALGGSLVAIRGYAHAETQAAYERSRVLCEAANEVPQLASALNGLAILYVSRGDLDSSLALADRLLAIAEATHDDALLVNGHQLAGGPRFYQGKFAASLEHSEQAIARYDSARHRRSLYGTDHGVGAFGYAAWGLWELGYPEQALGRARAGVVLARTIAHPLSLAYALGAEAVLRGLRRDTSAQRECAEELVALSEAQGFPLWLGLGRALRAAGRTDPGAVVELTEGFALMAETGLQAGAPIMMGTLAETYGAAGRPAEALGVIETALAMAGQTGQHCHDAELHRLAGEVLLATKPDGAVDAENRFRQAFGIARTQEARSLELRAAMSLARLLAAQRKPVEARVVLAPTYGTFTEGFDTRDLIEAKELLAELD